VIYVSYRIQCGSASNLIKTVSSKFEVLKWRFVSSCEFWNLILISPKKWVCLGKKFEDNNEAEIDEVKGRRDIREEINNL